MSASQSHRVGAAIAGLLLLASGALGCGDERAADASGDPAAGDAGTPAAEARLIDDGGALLLPDGAIVYVELWARPCPRTSTLTYESFGRDFFGSYCLGCHSAARVGKKRGGASLGINFDELSGIREFAPDIWAQAADLNRAMPAGGEPPSAEQRRMLGDWLACGAASESDQPDE